MSSSTKRVLNNWTEAQRSVLHLLYTHFTFFDATTRTQIFNFMFKNELQASGIHGGLGDVALHSQYRDRTRKDREHLWTNVLRDPQTDAEERGREELIERIKDAAVTLEVVTRDGTLRSAREAHIPETQAGDDDEGDGELRTPPKKARSFIKASSESVLDMLHYKDLTWTANRPSIDSLRNALMKHSSPIYKRGGQVHRIIIDSDNIEADFMVCDTSICTDCSKSTDPTLPSETEGLPFVHSSDTVMDQKRTYFRPNPKVHLSDRPKHFQRHVQFKGIDGDVSCWARICANIGCRVCMRGSVQRNPRLWERYAWEGGTSGVQGSEESGDVDAQTEDEGLDRADE
jgi:hypothetical protein